MFCTRFTLSLGYKKWCSFKLTLLIIVCTKLIVLCVRLSSAVNPQFSPAKHATDSEITFLGAPFRTILSLPVEIWGRHWKVGKSWQHMETAAKAWVLTVIDLTKEMKILWNIFWVNMLHIKSTLRPIVC